MRRFVTNFFHQAANELGEVMVAVVSDLGFSGRANGLVLRARIVEDASEFRESFHVCLI